MKTLSITELSLPRVLEASRLFGETRKAFGEVYALPLFLESEEAPRRESSGAEAEFCRLVNPPLASCTRCSLRKLPPLASLEPWAWSMNCRAGLRLSAVPIGMGSRPVAWLLTGHVIAGEGPRPAWQTIREQLCDEGVAVDERHMASYVDIRRMPYERYRRMVEALAALGVILASCLNGLLVDPDVEDPWEYSRIGRLLDHRQTRVALDAMRKAAPAGKPPMMAKEFGIRRRLEASWLAVLAGGGTRQEIREVARDCGWRTEADLLTTFRRYFHACLRDFRRQVIAAAGVWRKLSGADLFAPGTMAVP